MPQSNILIHYIHTSNLLIRYSLSILQSLGFCAAKECTSFCSQIFARYTGIVRWSADVDGSLFDPNHLQPPSKHGSSFVAPVPDPEGTMRAADATVVADSGPATHVWFGPSG